MTISRHIRLNAFDMACVGHIQHGMWTHPRDRSSDYTSLDHWVRLARMLERGLFDGLFLADVLGAYDVYGGNAGASLRAGVQIPLLDPMALVPAMAYATTHLGFGVTCNLAYEAPFLFGISGRHLALVPFVIGALVLVRYYVGEWLARGPAPEHP